MLHPIRSRGILNVERTQEINTEFCLELDTMLPALHKKPH